MTIRASGTLMKNTQRQDRYCTSQPPSTGPSTEVTEVKPDQVPIAWPRRSLANELLISARLPGTSSAPPMPWTARATINMLLLGASPHQTEASAKRAVPATKTLRRPNRSPSEPPTRMSAERKSAYASTTHWTSAADAWNSLCNAGRAMFTTEPSIKAMLEPRIVATSTHTPLGRAGRQGGAERIISSSHGALIELSMLAAFLQEKIDFSN